MFSAAIFRSTSHFQALNPCIQQLFYSFNSIDTTVKTKPMLIDPNPPLVGQAIEIKEFLRENAVSFDESWTCIKAICCRSSTRISGLIHIDKERGECRTDESISRHSCLGDFACSKCSTTGNWSDFKAQWEHIRTRWVTISPSTSTRASVVESFAES